MLEQLTYAQIGARLAPTMAEPWSLSISMSCNKPTPARSPCDQAVIDVVATLKTRIEQLEAELAAERQRYEHEHERADMLARGQEILDIQLKNLRLSLQTERKPVERVAPWTLREWWRWLRISRPAARSASEQLRLR